MTTIIIVTTGHGFWLWQKTDGISAAISRARGNIKVQPPKILDNKQQGRVIDELRSGLRPGAKVAVISAYFTIYAYEALKIERGGSFLFWCGFTALGRILHRACRNKKGNFMSEPNRFLYAIPVAPIAKKRRIGWRIIA